MGGAAGLHEYLWQDCPASRHEMKWTVEQESTDRDTARWRSFVIFAMEGYARRLFLVSHVVEVHIAKGIAQRTPTGVLTGKRVFPSAPLGGEDMAADDFTIAMGEVE